MKSTYLVLAAAIAQLAASIPASAAGGSSPAPITGVVELFTSQGCSSCPPADALIEQYARREGVLALSFNVDYWDSLGWKDTLASHRYTQRQQAYAQSRGDGQVYTPQAVIDGVAHAVGSDRRAIDAALGSAASRGRAMQVPLVVSRRQDGVSVTIDAAADGVAGARGATLVLAKITPTVEVAIGRGENSGQTIAYHNVVREFTSVGTYTGGAQVIAVGQSALVGCTPGTCALMLQTAGAGAILGAAWVPVDTGT